jgi:Protein of unknown function (DUF1822)
MATLTQQKFVDLVRQRTSLSQWFQKVVESEWQSITSYKLRQAIPTRSSASIDEISQTIARLKSIENEFQRHQLIEKLASLAQSNGTIIPTDRQDAIQTLVELIQSSSNDETLWIAVDSLRQVAPKHPSAGMRKLRSIDLGEMVNFAIDIIPKKDNKFDLLLQLYPDRSSAYLPINLKLILQDEWGNNLREIVAGNDDYCIQLKLSGGLREIFSVSVELDGIESIEDFVI